MDGSEDFIVFTRNCGHTTVDGQRAITKVHIVTNWKTKYCNVFKCTTDTYIQWLQTQKEHRILPTNSLLYKMKLVDTNVCTFCLTQGKTLIHFVLDCEKS